MRVLLPLKKTLAANQHSSSSSLSEYSDSDYEEEQSESEFVQLHEAVQGVGAAQQQQQQQASLQHQTDQQQQEHQEVDQKQESNPKGIIQSETLASTTGSNEVTATLNQGNNAGVPSAAIASSSATAASTNKKGSLVGAATYSDPFSKSSPADAVGLSLEDSKPKPTTQPSATARKRRSVDADLKPPSRKKRPVADRKLPAKESKSSMVGAGRIRTASGAWRYSDESRDDPAADLIGYNHFEPHENDPASAHGEPVLNRVKADDDADEDETYQSNFDFDVALKKRGLEIKEQEGDGNCLFRAVSLQVYGDPSMHGEIRKRCLDFMERDEEHFAQFVTGEPFAQYIRRKRQDGVHGNNPEIQAISELFNRPVEVFVPQNGATPLNIFHAEYKTADAPIRLSYHDGNHYNAVVDPLVPTAGLGLGLPGLQPGLADKMQMAKAVAESDAMEDQREFKRAMKESHDDELQRALKESSLSAEHMYNNHALALSDMDATYFELEQAALERSLHSYSKNEQGKKQQASNGRRRRSGRSSPNGAPAAASVPIPESVPLLSAPSSNNAVASLPSNAASIPQAAAAAASATSVASVASASRDDSSVDVGAADEYPQTVQELVMNGFELSKVVRAYELIGDNFDNLLSFLMSNSS